MPRPVHCGVRSMLAGLPTGSRQNCYRMEVRKISDRARPAPRHIAFLGTWGCGMRNPCTPWHVQAGPLYAQPRPGAKGTKELLLWNSPLSFRKLVGLKQSGSLNWVRSWCADTRRGIMKVPWGDVQGLLEKLASDYSTHPSKTPFRSQRQGRPPTFLLPESVLWTLRPADLC